VTGVTGRAATGVGALDLAIEGGLPASRVTLVTGDSGAGKTTLAMQFLAEGDRRGEPGIFIALDEKPAHIAEAAARFGWPISTAPGSPVLLLDGSPALSLMRQRQHAIDALPALVPPELTESEEEEFFRDLVFALEDNLACTTIVVTSDGDPRAARISAVAARLASGVIDLRLRETEGRLHRRLLVRKMRATASDGVERAFEIGPSGLIAGQA